MDNVRTVYGPRLEYTTHPMDALENAEALAIATEWAEFRTPDFGLMKKRMARPVIFDGRNLYDPTQVREEGFTYYSIGRPPVRPSTNSVGDDTCELVRLPM
jgi:UDPglucose 6-dehydrogenase